MAARAPRLRTLAALLVVGAAAAGAARRDPRLLPVQQQPTFRTESQLVVLHVRVKDRRGAYVTGLPPSAFTIFDEGVPQPIALFSREDSPVTVGLLIDNSGSMYTGRDRVVAAAAAFAATSNPGDELFALLFNEQVRPVLPPSMAFTSDPAMLGSALGDAGLAYGRTALYDAIAEGLAYVSRGSHPRRVLIVVADGGDNASRATFDDVLRQAQASNAAIYTVGIIDPLERGASRGRLRQLAQTTGGEAFFPGRVDDVAEVLRHIARDIRHTYTIGYVPPADRSTGAYRRLRVVVTVPDGRQLEVRTRSGYVAGPGGRRVP
jgi:Ca-activated chloride channel family protein